MSRTAVGKGPRAKPARRSETEQKLAWNIPRIVTNPELRSPMLNTPIGVWCVWLVSALADFVRESCSKQPNGVRDTTTVVGETCSS